MNARGANVHYGWVIAAVTFVVMLMTSAIRATPGLFMVPLEAEFGWSRAIISASIAVNIALYGLIGPFAASLMDRWGLRRVVLGALALMAGAVTLSTRMSAEWQFFLLWGVLVGAGTGVTAMVLAAVVTTRWFDQRRGLVMGVLSAANATGQLIFLPQLATVVESSNWRSAALIVAAAAAVVFVLVLLFMRDRPADLGLRAYGQAPDAPQSAPVQSQPPLSALSAASRTRAFWILAGTFFVCGASTNGLIGTHLISACHDVGISAIRSTRLLAMMGIFDILGTTASGWLTDRYSPRRLLCAYYSLRGLSLLFLPATLLEGGMGLGVFAVFYGLDWIATVPPTVKLTTEVFGKENTGVVYGWISASHQLGASMAAFGAGAIRTEMGDYRLAFMTAGMLCLIAGMSFIVVGRVLRPRLTIWQATD
ncbi:MAG TPA: MFS transporter [Candidatus Solibacter sp.]|nr:MFS transporter [Candidatus Solibacter sp.]